ncbi:MAG: isoleucine--tRNA ligase [Alphaproteobacteria bacterium]
MTTDYRPTVFLPRTGFAMKAELPKREPDFLALWDGLGLYQRLRAQSKGREKFVLHDGPPYANGHLHLGHALNKILKDVIVRSQQMLGKDSVYVPGWDCHGLPIEWQIEQNYRKAGKDKDAVPVAQFRAECRAFAEHWIGVQREEFKRLGVIGDWDNPYTTMSFAAEAQIVRELGKFLVNGSLYRGARPVMWSVVEKTALAEAEVEYHDHTSTTIWVRFKVIKPGAPALDNASVLIWTTTPWTIPGNRAISFGPSIRYQVIEANGEKLVVAAELAGQIAKDLKLDGYKVVADDLPAAALAATVCAHPWRGRGYDFDVPLLAGAHVTVEQGTGFVHTAPGHGVEDFEVVREHNASEAVRSGRAAPIETPETVGDDGVFAAHVPLVAGQHVFKVDDLVADELAAAGALAARGKLTHSYPHSWRSKAPLIFRTTPQWFISMSVNGLRETALAAIDQVRWVPPSGRQRIRAMIEQRPDWVVSRQRIWGVPITVFVDRRSGEPLRDPKVVERVAAAVEQEGAEAWFDSEPARFLAPDYDAANYERVTDILDVWFDSGATHSYVLEQRPELMWPASLYLEGSDQHRGWFHSSLLEACGTRGRAPYEAVLTHGFFVDGEGRKMSKSLGNVVAPQAVIDQHGADILRLWVVSTDYTEDMRISPEILRYQADSYRRLRNTLRYLLGSLDGFSADERLPVAEMPPLERYILHRLHRFDADLRRWCDEFNFHAIFSAVHNLCAVELSALYFDVRKDALYCDRWDAPRRRAVRSVLDTLFDCLTAWLAPLIPFTAEEAWRTRHQEPEASVHLRNFPEIPAAWRDDALAETMEKLLAVRRVITKALELARAEKKIGASLEAWPELFIDEAYRDALALKGLSLPELGITSGLTVRPFAEAEGESGLETLPDVPGVAVRFRRSEHAKCGRCWQLLPDVGADAAYPELCGRCVDAVQAHRAAAE